jgi:hypothetical protein
MDGSLLAGLPSAYRNGALGSEVVPEAMGRLTTHELEESVLRYPEESTPPEPKRRRLRANLFAGWYYLIVTNAGNDTTGEHCSQGGLEGRYARGGHGGAADGSARNEGQSIPPRISWSGATGRRFKVDNRT